MHRSAHTNELRIDFANPGGAQRYATHESDAERCSVDPLSRAGHSADLLERLLRNAKPIVPNRLRATVEGAVLATGRIRALHRIGGGATGTVYEALDGESRVALKVLNDLNPHQIYRLKQEFRLLLDFAHPNVVAMYDLFGTESDWFFTMELVHGRPFDEHCAERTDAVAAQPGEVVQLSTEYVAGLRAGFAQLIEGVAAVHQAGLLHRDLKPSNVLVEPSGRIVILDFGLVSEQAPGGVGQTEQSICGTPAYMAPEQALGERATPASDWYAVGVMLYQSIARRMPHSGFHPAELFRKKQLEEPAPLSRLATPVPDDLVQLTAALLRRDPALRPSTDQLLAAARSWASLRVCDQPEPISRNVSPAGVSAGPLVGRSDVVQRVERALREVRSEGPSLILLEGASGIGKTTLLRHMFERMQRVDDAFGLEGRCYHRESVPYKAFDGVIDHMSRVLRRLPPAQSAQLIPRHLSALLRLFPVLKRVDVFREAASRLPEVEDGYELRQQGLDAMRELLCRIADRRPLFLVIDDLQWGDADSTRLLMHVTTPPNAPRMLVVASIRSDDEAADEMRGHWTAIEHLRTEQITLGGLSESDAETLVRDTLGTRSAEAAAVAQSIARDAAGNPLFVVELAQGYLAGQLGEQAPTFHQMISRRIHGLSSASQQALNLVTVAEQPLSRSALAHASGKQVSAEALDELRSARLLRVLGSSNDHAFDVYHDRVREVAASMIADAELPALHRQLAEALEATHSAGDEVLSLHWRGAGDRERAAHHARLAADQAAAALAFNRAADLYRLAIDLGQDEISLWQSYAHALSSCGRSATAAEVFLAMARRSPQRQRQRFEAAAASHWLRSGHVNEAITLLQQGLTRAGVTWPSSQPVLLSALIVNRARIRLTRLQYQVREEAHVPSELLDQLDAIYPAQTAFGTFDYLRGAFFASLALPLALKAGEPVRLITALATEAVYGTMLGGTRNASRERWVCSQLASLAMRADSTYGRAASALAAAVCAFWGGRWEAVIGPATEAERGFRNDVIGGTWEATLVRSVRHTVFVHAGRFADMSAELPALVAESRARNDLYAYLDLARSLITVQLARDDQATASKELADLQLMVHQLPYTSLGHLLLSTNVAHHLYIGDPAFAKRRLDVMWSQCRSNGLHRFPLLRSTVLGMQGDCAYADQRTPHRKRSQQLLVFARKLAAEPIAWAPAAAASLRARAYELVGDEREERVQLRFAARAYRARGMLLPAALVEQRLATLLPDRDEEQQRLSRSATAVLEACAIARPERWREIMHSIY